MSTFLFFLLILLSNINVFALQQFTVDDFEKEELNQLPNSWFNRDGDKSVPSFSVALRNTYLYEINKEGENQFLRFHGINGKHLNFPLKNKDLFDLSETPILHWRWRIRTIPEGASEDSKLDDTAASIYVVFSFNWLKIPRVIKYSWSSKLPVGTTLSKNLNQLKVIVVGSGQPKSPDQWLSFQRNVMEDYQKLFRKEPPKKPVALLILSDGDDTKKPVEADYDDLFFSSQPINPHRK